MYPEDRIGKLIVHAYWPRKVGLILGYEKHADWGGSYERYRVRFGDDEVLVRPEDETAGVWEVINASR